MKRTSVILNTILFAVIALFAGSCKEEGRIYKNMVSSVKLHKLNLSQYEIDIPTPESETVKVNVSTTYTDWEFAEIPEWVTVTPKSGSGDAEVSIEVAGNNKAESRVGVMSFRSTNSDWHYSAAFTITQYRAPYTISVENDAIDMDGAAGNTTVRVNTNTDNWTVIVPSTMDWCTVQKNDNGIVISVTNNTGNASRSGIIELHTEDVSEFLTVTQRPAGIRSTSERVDFPVEGGMNSFSINPDAPWTIETAYSWIRVSPSEGEAGSRTIILEVNANYSFAPRNGYIYVVISADNKIEIPVHQDGIELSVSRDTLTVPSSGETYPLSVNSNVAWKFVDSIPDWISVDPQNGSGNSSVQIKVDLNREPESRQAEIWLTPVASDNRVPILIQQDGRVFGADSAYIYFSDEAGTTYFNIKSNGLLWLINTADDWITLTPDYGTESARIAVSVTANESDSTRVGRIMVVTAGQKEYIKVYQSGRIMNVSSKALDFNSKGGSAVVSISSNRQWTASVSAPWISLSSTSGEGDCNLTITASDNPSATERTGEIRLNRSGANPVTISVTQAARYLSLSTESIYFFEAGGTSDPIVAQTDGVLAFENENSWLTVTKETSSQFTISALPNNESAPRSGNIIVWLEDITNGSLSKTISVTQNCYPTRDYVDLGLSVYWATCNVGAESPEGYGGQYAWGEITEKNSYYDSNWYWSNGSKTSLTKYNSYSSYGTVDYKTVLDPEDDVAHVLWGGNWRIPTREELEELVNNCTWTWTTMNNLRGYKVTSCVPGYTDRYIFLPAAGNAWGSSYHGSSGTEASYWSSNTSVNYFTAWNLHFNPSVFSVGDESRNPGLSIRPVLPIEGTEGQSVTLNRTMLSILEGKEDTLVATVKSNVRAIGYTVFTSSDNEIATVNDNGVITAISPGTCVITATYGSAQAECKVTVTSASAQPVAVDLGLSVKWASFNLGTDRPEGPGYYFAWGETEKKSIYNWGTYKYCQDANYRLTTKYCDDSMWGYPDNKYILDSDDDAATVMWGSDWRTPSTDEMRELIENCTWVWTTENGVEGYRVTSNITGYTDQSIFLPAAGTSGVDHQMGVGLFGHYWTNSIRGAGWVAAWKLYFTSSNASTSAANNYKMFCDNRLYGFPIRPVTSASTNVSPIEAVDSIVLSKNKLSISVGDTITIFANPLDENGNAITAKVYWHSSDSTVAWVENGLITAVGTGTCNIIALVGNAQSSCALTVTPAPSLASGFVNGYGYVDLGLGVKWATNNVGATAPEGFGDYYAWGEIKTYYVSGYAQAASPVWESGKTGGYSCSNYKYCMGSLSSLSKYCDVSEYGNNGFVDGKTRLERDDDVANDKWGGNWHIPTWDDILELKGFCTCCWTSFRGVNGLLVISNMEGYEDTSIFLPASGRREETTLSGLDDYGFYWISDLVFDSPQQGCAYLVKSPEITLGFNGNRNEGNVVRPVYSDIYMPKDTVSIIQLSLTEVSLSIGDTITIIPTPLDINNNTIRTDVQWSSSDSSVASIDRYGFLSAVGVGTCTITACVSTVQSICSVTVTASSIVSATPEYVDLGLSVNWATFNVGANVPEDYGDYFAWGETEPYYADGSAQSTSPVWRPGKSDGYAWSSYSYCNGSNTSLTKYNNDSSKGYVDNKSVLELDDDVAHVKWGGSWRMPTKEEQDELRDSCTWVWTTLNGINGYRVTSNKSGYQNQSIFLPAAGVYNSTGPISALGSDAYYWSSTIMSDASFAYLLGFASYKVGWQGSERDYGQSVRPVCPSSTYVPPVIVASIELSETELNMTVGDDSTHLVATPKDANGNAVTANVQWSSSNPDVADVSVTGGVMVVGPGTCTITAYVGTVESTCTVIVVAKATPEYVDLGLSVNWATFNVGANAPEEYGDYFAWGETETYYEAGYAQSVSPVWKSDKSDGYAWSSYSYCNGSNTALTKYCGNSDYGYNGFTDTKVVLDPEDDVAHVRWGGDWRIPSAEEQNELFTNCAWVWTVKDGVNGYLITSNEPGYSDRSIFLPAAGSRSSTGLDGVGSYGDYWSSSLTTLFEYIPDRGRSIHISASDFLSGVVGRNHGYSVRPVCPSSTYVPPVSVASIELSETELNMTVGDDSTHLVATPKDANGNAVTANVQWSSSNPNVADVSGTGAVMVVGPGTCTITAYVGTVESTCTVTVSTQTSQVYEYVDLGLSVKWATYNVGATKPEEYGDYYAWGETEPYYEDGFAQSTSPIWRYGKSGGYDWSSYVYCAGEDSTLTKYCDVSYCGYNYFTDNIFTLELQDDVARTEWGGNWRMPTSAEMEELYNDCTWEWTTVNNVNGYKVTSQKSGFSGHYIFLPAAGFRSKTGSNDVGSIGGYWSSSVYKYSPCSARSVYFSSFECYADAGLDRYYGLPVRPVCP